MKERTQVNVTKEAHREAKKSKTEGETWTDYILRCADSEPAEETSQDLGEILHKLEQIESAQANTVSDSLELAESGIDEREVARMVSNDLEATLPNMIRDAMQER